MYGETLTARLADFQRRLSENAVEAAHETGAGRRDRVEGGEEEELVWALLDEQLLALLGASYKVMFSTRCEFGYPVLVHGDESLRLGSRVYCGDAWCELHVSEHVTGTKAARDVAEVMSGLALSAHVGARNRRLMQAHAEGVAFVTENFVHLARNDVAALANLGQLAAAQGAKEDFDAFNEAIEASAGEAQQLLRLFKLLGDAAFATQEGRAVAGDVAAVLGADASVPDGARCLGFDTETLREFLAVPRQFLTRERGPIRERAGLHPDGWVLTLDAAEAADASSTEFAWTETKDLPLGFAAWAFSIFGGRTWGKRDEIGPARLGLTLPGA